MTRCDARRGNSCRL